MSARSSFLQRRPLPEARALVLGGVQVVDTEDVAVDDAAGRISAEDVMARHDSPHYRASAMDGIALRSKDTRAAADAPVLLRSLAPDAAAPADDDPCCLPVDTGGQLPEWCDAVARIEDVTATDDGYLVRSVVRPGADVRRAGEDIEKGTLVLPAGARVRAWEVGALLGTGTTTIRVRRRPRVAVLATGSEVVEPGGDARPGQVIDSNSRVIAALVEDWGGSAHRLGIVADDEDALREAIADAAARFDAVCVIAGSSAGRRDLTVPVLASLGEVLAHGVDIAPGRPVALARVPRDAAGTGRVRGGRDAANVTPVLGVPGYPVSAIVVCEQLLRPLVSALLGRAEPAVERLRARVVRRIPSRLGMEEFRRVLATRQADGSYVAAALPSGAASISTVSGAHAWLRIEATSEGIDPGDEVDVELLVSRNEVDASLVLAGSAGPASADLERALRRGNPLVRVHHLRRGENDQAAAVAAGEAHGYLVPRGAVDVPENDDALESRPLSDGNTLLIVRTDCGAPFPAASGR